VKIKRFEDILAWQKARELNKMIYTITQKKSFSKDYTMIDQIRRVSMSIASNITEGFGRQTDKEFIQFLYIAKGFISEVQSQLYLSLDLGYIGKDEFKAVFDSSIECEKIINGLIRYLKRTNNPTND
jgi:four helix bundle protein